MSSASRVALRAFRAHVPRGLAPSSRRSPSSRPCTSSARSLDSTVAPAPRRPHPAARHDLPFRRRLGRPGGIDPVRGESGVPLRQLGRLPASCTCADLSRRVPVQVRGIGPEPARPAGRPRATCRSRRRPPAPAAPAGAGGRSTRSRAASSEPSGPRSCTSPCSSTSRVPSCSTARFARQRLPGRRAQLRQAQRGRLAAQPVDERGGAPRHLRPRSAPPSRWSAPPPSPRPSRSACSRTLIPAASSWISMPPSTSHGPLPGLPRDDAGSARRTRGGALSRVDLQPVDAASRKRSVGPLLHLVGVDDAAPVPAQQVGEA